MDESTVDLRKIFKYLISNIYKILIGGLVTASIGFAYLLTFPPEYISSIKFSELSQLNKDSRLLDEISVELGDIKSQMYDIFNTDTDEDNVEIGDLISFSTKTLDSDLEKELTSPQQLALAFAENLRNINNIEKALDKSSIEYENLNNEAKKSNLRYLRQKNQYDVNYEFSYRHQEKEKSIAFIINVIDIANANLINLIKDNIRSELNILDNLTEDFVERLNKAVEFEKEATRISMEDRYELLKEQSRMARALNIDTPVDLTRIAQDNDKRNSLILIERNKLYLDGFTALEAEMEIIKERNVMGRFSKSIRSIEKKVKEIERHEIDKGAIEKMLERIDNSTSMVTLDLYRMTTDKTKSRSLILLLSFFIGVGLASISLIYWRIYFIEE